MVRDYLFCCGEVFVLDDILCHWSTGTSPGNQFNDAATSDLKLTLNNREGCNITVSVHRHILVTHSRFFAAKLPDRWSKQQQRTIPNLIEITDIDDVEIYLATLRLMYCEDVKRSLVKENVGRILAILKVRCYHSFLLTKKLWCD
jgi:hypothetical protein